jgi:hypothetical protein
MYETLDKYTNNIYSDNDIKTQTKRNVRSMLIKDAIMGAGSDLGKPSKMPCRSYGLPPAACRVGAKLRSVVGSTCANCYAGKGNYIYRNVQIGQARRLAALRRGLANGVWINAMVRLVDSRCAVSGNMRWHDSGDILSVAHFAAICEIARRTPGVAHWIPTRETSTIARYLRDGGIIPVNLTVRISAAMIGQRVAARIVRKLNVVSSSVDATNAGWRCPAPQQGGKCGDCRACWSGEVSNVDYHEH